MKYIIAIQYPISYTRQQSANFSLGLCYLDVYDTCSGRICLLRLITLHSYSSAKCPAGYKTVNETCEACEIGTYNGAEGALECLACDGDKTTYGTGSTKADQCYELCTVPEVGMLSSNSVIEGGDVVAWRGKTRENYMVNTYGLIIGQYMCTFLHKM